jgi:hypothetical protein
MHFGTVVAFAHSISSRIRAGALMFFTGNVTVGTFTLVLTPVAVCAILIAFRI